MLRYKIVGLIFSTLILFVLSTDNQVTKKFLELDEVEGMNNKQLNLDKFLANAADDFLLSHPVLRASPITIEDCMKDSVCKLTNIKVTPTELQKGKPISMKAQGVFTAEKDVTSLHVEAYYNGDVIYKNDVDKPSHQGKGPYIFSYDNNVPTFTPAGHWETYVYLMGGEEKLACIKATFETS